MPRVHQPKVRISKSVDNSDPYNFVLQFKQCEIDGLVASREKNVKQDEAFEAGKRIARGDYSRENLRIIVDWKIPEFYLPSEMRNLTENSDTQIAEALRLAAVAQSEKAAAEALTRGTTSGLHGVGMPVASAILTTVNPAKYTIIDVYALKSLGVGDRLKHRVDYYLVYLQKCRELARQFNISLRTMDHALWQWGYDNRQVSSQKSPPCR
jgi:hypothetical protein